MISNVKFIKMSNRIAIKMWMNEAYDHEEGYYEIAHIKLSKSGASFMDDIDLDEIQAILKEYTNRNRKWINW